MALTFSGLAAQYGTNRMQSPAIWRELKRLQMSITKRGGMWWIRFQFRGQRVQQTTGLAATQANKSAANEQERQLRTQMEAAKGLRRIRREFTQASESFLRWVEQEADAPATAQRNRTSFASLNEFFAGWKVDEITAAAVEDYKTWRLTVHQVKRVTVRHDLDALSKFFRRFAIPRGMASVNPMTDVQRPSDRDSRSMYVLSDREEEAYFRVARRHRDLHDLARLILLTGARPSEILSLRVCDCERSMVRIQRGKTAAARRTIHLTDDAIAIIERRKRQGGEWLFPSGRTSSHIVKLNGAHDDACNDAGVFFRLYDLRHTYATRAIASGEIDVPTLAALMGHANLRAIHLYVHPQESTKRAAVERYNKFLHATKSVTPRKKGAQ